MPSTAICIPTRPRYRWARAYRHGELVCGRVDVRVWDNGRLGLTAHERREVAVRFLECLAPGFRRELDGLLRRRGDVARRIAERMEAIELVADHQEMGDLRIVGHVQPPQRRHGEMYEIEFGLRELPDEQAGGSPPAARAPDPRSGSATRPAGGRGDG